MLLSTRKNRRVIAINLLILGMLLGYQNCSDNGASFAATKLETPSGSQYMVVGVTGTRYVGEEDTFRVQAVGDTLAPNSVEWTILIPNALPITGNQNEMTHQYAVVGLHTFNVRIVGARNEEIEYNFAVDVRLRPGNCSPVGGGSLHLAGPVSLSQIGRARYEVNNMPECFNVTEAPVWRVKDSSGNIVSGNTASSIQLFPSQKAMEFTFTAPGTYTVESDVVVVQTNETVTLMRSVTVGGESGPCNPSDFTITYDPKVVPGINNFVLNLPPCFNQSTVTRYDWDFNYNTSKPMPEVTARVPSATYNFKSTEGMTFLSENTYSSKVRITIHHEPTDQVEIIERDLLFTYNKNTCSIDDVVFEKVHFDRPEMGTDTVRVVLPENLSEADTSVTYNFYDIVNGSEVLEASVESSSLTDPLIYKKIWRTTGEKRAEAVIRTTQTQGAQVLKCNGSIKRELFYDIYSVQDDSTPDAFNINDFGDSEAGGGVSNTVTIRGITTKVDFIIEYHYQGDQFSYRKNGGAWVEFTPPPEQSYGQQIASAVIKISPNDTLQFQFIGNEDQAYLPQGQAKIYLGNAQKPLLDSFSFRGGRP